MSDDDDFVSEISAEAWFGRLRERGEIGALLALPWEQQLARGYGHTLREICQQPGTWLETAARVTSHLALVEATLDDAGASRGQGAIVLTGSGSSLYAGQCVALPLQQVLRVPVSAVPAGQLLTHPESSLPPSGPYAVVSFARSGNSPESRAVVDSLLAERRACHLVLTCNGHGALATHYQSVPGVRTIVLDEATNDKGLVMTSSFTNMVLAGRLLGHAHETDRYLARARVLARAAAGVLTSSADALGRVARQGFTSAVFLGSGSRVGSAHETALKMLEMNDGRVWTLPESYLGFRHGPMSAVRADTLVVAFLSSDPMVRSYEVDLIRELDRKRLGARRVIVGASLPRELAGGAEGVLVDVGPETLDDADLVLIDVLVGQLLAFFCCLNAKLRPDSPSTQGVINRVVSGFEIHTRRSSHVPPA
jgi:tagatose-6-phosphate ketose/aldose isomerase